MPDSVTVMSAHSRIRQDADASVERHSGARLGSAESAALGEIQSAYRSEPAAVTRQGLVATIPQLAQIDGRSVGSGRHGRASSRSAIAGAGQMAWPACRSARAADAAQRIARRTLRTGRLTAVRFHVRMVVTVCVQEITVTVDYGDSLLNPQFPAFSSSAITQTRPRERRYSGGRGGVWGLSKLSP